jgi:hypothetical protein
LHFLHQRRTVFNLRLTVGRLSALHRTSGAEYWRNSVFKFEGATALLIAIAAQALVVGAILAA